MSMDTSTSGGGQGDDDIKVKNVSEIINCSLDLARELLANCGGDVNQVIDNFCGSGSQSVQKNEVEKASSEESLFYERVEDGGDRDNQRVKCLLCSDGRLVPLRNFSQHVKEVHEAQVPSHSVKKNEADVETGATIPAQEGSVTSGGISSMMKRKKPPVESIITIDDSEDDENQDDYDPIEKKKFKKLREDLSDYLVNVRKAKYMSNGEEEEDRMTLEDCPMCSAPQILPDKTVKLYHCPECGAITCRKCLLQAHGDRECQESKEDEEVKEVDVEYKKVTVLPSRNFDMDNELDREFRIAEGQFLRMAGAKRKCYEIKSVDVVYNKKLKEKFDDKKQELQRKRLDDKPLLIFHGTPQENIEPILRDNFDLTKVANGRKFGNGVYFSEMPEVSLGYSRDQSSLILCMVLQGDNTKEVSNPTGFAAVDSVMSKSGAWAIIVPDVDQILPKYVINFVDKPKDKRNKNVPSFGSIFPPGIMFHHSSRPTTLINHGAGASGSAQQQGNLVSNLYNQHLQGGGLTVHQYQGSPSLTGYMPGQASAGIAPGVAQSVPVSQSYYGHGGTGPLPGHGGAGAPGLVPHTYHGICHLCKVEFTSEAAMNSHMQGARHMKNEIALMSNPVQPVSQGQTGNTSSQHQHPAHQAATNQHTHCCNPAAVSSLTDRLLQIMSQGRGTIVPQMPPPQMMPVPSSAQVQTQNGNMDVMSRFEQLTRIEKRRKAEQLDADASKATFASLPTLEDQEPKPPLKVKLMVEDVDASGTAVSGTRVDLPNCRDLYCALCDVWMISKEMMWAHKKGEEHIKQMMEVNKKEEKDEEKETDAE